MTTKTKTKPKAKITPLEASDAALSRAAEFASEYGRIQEIADAMTELTGIHTSRQMVGRWLHVDPLKRVQTTFGNALLLLYIIDCLEADSMYPTREINITVAPRTSKGGSK